ncbi:hypothetical protein ACJ73_06629 [Blastomyces percursus]|uniref:Uncharacterized protein n=1 Tax=Blastomyces percursus TaxID=1658174 RepID=A0A1J9Q0A0_9EURO|nr:hypothetical protein ACJ73_06629 [Blastomyces percursus]
MKALGFKKIKNQAGPVIGSHRYTSNAKHFGPSALDSQHREPFRATGSNVFSLPTTATDRTCSTLVINMQTPSTRDLELGLELGSRDLILVSHDIRVADLQETQEMKKPHAQTPGFGSIIPFGQDEQSLSIKQSINIFFITASVKSQASFRNIILLYLFAHRNT